MDSTEICGRFQALLLAGFPSLGIQASSKITLDWILAPREKYRIVKLPIYPFKIVFSDVEVASIGSQFCDCYPI